ncbi:hypothetical protein VF21_05527 [Pseudogymnoascus sp. 05NY08]|nr:hypothetical protein VF21_05527 [Pseudogymnoascus sp. 05NY08]
MPQLRFEHNIGFIAALFIEPQFLVLQLLEGLLCNHSVAMMRWKARLGFKDDSTTTNPVPDRHKVTTSFTPPTPTNPSSSILDTTTKNEVNSALNSEIDFRPSETQQSEISRFDALVTPESKKHARQRSIDRRNDPLGLSILYTPNFDEPTADVIFVHGLGGSSRMSWSYNRDENLFWPEAWLPTEPDIRTARILSFGYNAYFASQGPNSIAGIGDFAKQLLFDMKFGKDSLGEDLNVGHRPIIFVVHSMGGLVFKKAVMQGHNDDEFKGLISQVKAVLFLSTPHRGTNLAETLNRILSVSIFNHSPKRYVSELKKNSPFIEDINEEFRKHAPGLQIFSFYETLETAIGPKRVLILQRASSTLEYPHEVTMPLNADHHRVCKFPNREDPSYRSIKGVIKSLVSSYREAKAHLQQTQSTAENEKLISLLGTFSNPEEDYTYLLQLWRQGTCQGALLVQEIQDWTDNAFKSKILWIYGQPGGGKSVTTAVYIQDMKQRGLSCAYYFFRYGDSRKRSPGSLLQSLIYQIAQELPTFRQSLVAMKDYGVAIEKMSPQMIWNRIFKDVLFKIEAPKPLYIIIDALDEADSISTIVGFFQNIETSRMPIRLLVTSRKLPDITTAFDRIAPASLLTTLSLSDNLDDIRLYGESEMEYMHGSLKFRQEVLEAIISRAEGNFLWVTLAMKEVLQCHSLEDISQVLEEMPSGMESVYKRMEATVCRLDRTSDLAIAKSILSWAAYCQRPLTVNDFLQALPRDIPVIIDLRHTIGQLCGHFVVVDSNNAIILVHKTAREYLLKTAKLPFEFNSEHIHENLFQQSIGIFLEQNFRQKLSQKERLSQEDAPPFAVYAAASWAYHLSHSSAASNASLALLVKFLNSSSVLLWIRILASLKQLEVLITASGVLRVFAITRRKIESTTQHSQHRLSLEVVEQWSIDLLKIIGKFSSYIVDDPTAIQRLIPQFCPRRSAMYRQFGKQPHLLVRNISNDDWDDCLGRIAIDSGYQATEIACSTQHLAALTTRGKVFLWDCVTLEKILAITHAEFITAMCFNSTGEHLATYGYQTTKIWDVTTREELYTIQNLPESRALSIVFSDGDTKLVVGLDSRKVAVASYRESLTWSLINSGFLEGVEAGAYVNTPTTIAFNTDATLIAVGYRGFALEVWDMVELVRVNACKRRLTYDVGPDAGWTGVIRAVWHPSGESLLGIYTDGTVFKWNPFEESDHQELEADIYYCPSGIQCSPDGVLFLLSDQDGSVRLYNYEHFSLLYKLSSEDVVIDLCFSMDSRRFYDLRGSYCNIWEPNVLFRLSDSDYCSSDSDPESMSIVISNHASEAFVDAPVKITALAARPLGGLFWYGNEDGLVEVNNISTLKSQKAGNTKRGGAVEFLIRSEYGNYMAYSDIDSFTVKGFAVTSDGTMSASQTLFNRDCHRESGRVHQICLHPKGRFLLIAGDKFVIVYDVLTKEACAKLESDGSQKWANHPVIEDQLLALNIDTVSSYSWKGLEIMTQWGINKPHLVESKTGQKGDISTTSIILEVNRQAQDHVDKIIVSTTRNYAIMSISQEGPYDNRRSGSQIIKLADIQDLNACSISPIRIPNEIKGTIERPLGIIGKDRLVFIDRSFWICSWSIGSEQENAQRHFFLPRDWVTTEMLGLCAVTDDGIVLVPHKGEVAVIQSSLYTKRR